ncbi:unnamed protein product, partial [Hydatigera taeniaeformis]|uniref:Mediator of RNA polymerase II transcription subunit 13 n=1 Tax=Hydatigena taeniaeformis TaxID=6205 RepID=A0A0R3WW55_HYDTA
QQKHISLKQVQAYRFKTVTNFGGSYGFSYYLQITNVETGWMIDVAKIIPFPRENDSNSKNLCYSSTFSLDLFSSVLNLPTFASSVPFAECHERPDPACLYFLLHRLESPTEGMRLIAHVCIEASKVPSSLRDQALACRVSLLDVALQSLLHPCLHYIEYLAGFLDPPASLPPDLSIISQDSSNVARRLLLCLYLRRPGILYALKSSEAWSFLRTPSANGSIPECFEQKEVRLLFCFISDGILDDTSALQS